MGIHLGNRTGGRGQGLVEFALTLPIILLLIFGAFDLGRAVLSYNTLAESARQANRMAIVDQDATRVRDVAIAYAPTVGLTAADVDVCFKTGATTQRDCSNMATDACSPVQIGCLAIVTSRISYEPITPIINSIVPTIQLASTSIGPVEYVCPTPSKPNCP